PANQLVDGLREGTFIRYPAFNTLRYQFLLFLLEIAVTGTLLHRAQGTHSPVNLETPSLVDLDLTRAFFGPGKEVPQHYAVGAGGDAFCNIPRIPDPPVGNERPVKFISNPGALHDGGYLGHPNPGHYPGGAD